MNVIIETDRLLLRTFTEEDVDLIYLLNCDPDVTQYTCDRTFDLAQAEKNLQQVIHHNMRYITLVVGQRI